MWVLVCFLVAFILAALAAVGVPSGRFSLIAASLAFGWLGFLVPLMTAAG
jgi:hypothetical protein